MPPAATCKPPRPCEQARRKWSAPSSPLVGIIKELGVFDLPFLFANEKEADAVLDGPAGAYFNKKLEDAGLVNLAYWENGFRNLTNNKRPVAKAEDFEASRSA
ncbi:TRAP-type C4-dicarboxylate transport system, periplasmic component [Polaromonas sp. CG9_12]|nr:TRAP-type C4-dicarboxylate transport system, periplasmic component [Polaromonas sp. CG9_12]